MHVSLIISRIQIELIEGFRELISYATLMYGLKPLDGNFISKLFLLVLHNLSVLPSTLIEILKH